MNQQQSLEWLVAFAAHLASTNPARRDLGQRFTVGVVVGVALAVKHPDLARRLYEGSALDEADIERAVAQATLEVVT